MRRFSQAPGRRLQPNDCFRPKTVIISAAGMDSVQSPLVIQANHIVEKSSQFPALPLICNAYLPGLGRGLVWCESRRNESAFYVSVY